MIFGYCIKAMVKKLVKSYNSDLQNQDQRYDSNTDHFDEIDVRIMDLLILGCNNKEIATQMKIPLSTIQRRVRNLIHSQSIIVKSDINYEKFGFKTGLLHIYLGDGDINETAEKISEIEGIESVEIHIGNSDIIANVLYKHSKELLHLISLVKKTGKVEKIVWSEMIYKIDSKNNPSQFTKMATR